MLDLTEMSCTFISNSIVPEIESCECLQKMQKLSLTEMKKLIESYCVVLECLTEISCTFSSNFIVLKVELCEYLKKMEKLSFMKIH